MDWHGARTLKDRLEWAMNQGKGATQAELVRACKDFGVSVSRPSVSDWLSGKTKELKAGPLLAVSSHLKVSAVWLHFGIGAPGENVAKDDYVAPYSNMQPAAHVIQLLGNLVKSADPISRAALPGLLTMLVDQPDKAPEIGRKISSLMDKH